MFKIAPGLYEIPKTGAMRVPGLIVANEALLKDLSLAQPLEQVKNVACLPGVIGYSIAMPDIHWGYGFPIGGVAATDAASGVISPGGVGYDINCGVRLALLRLPFQEIKPKEKKRLLETLFANVPSGIGRGGEKSLSDDDYRSLIEKGARWSVEQGYGVEEDLAHTESHGVLSGGSLEAVSPHARERGKQQLGSVGSGNHFVEIGEVERLFDMETAAKWGVRPGDTYILIHSGSRGFGHQICQDTLDHFIKKGYAEGLPDRQLVAAPLSSSDGKRYFAAMAAAANYAFNNRQRILHGVRLSFQDVLGVKPEEVRQIYDVCHNIAKFETHGGKKVCVHRKGATRAFGAGSEELAPLYKETGQPVIVPGDMGRASHLLVGMGHPLTFASCCHGAGRALSRVKSRTAWHGRDPVRHMEAQGVQVKASSMRTITEEMPDAYKDVDVVVDAVEEAGLARKVARLKPALVIKG